jgi:hypothetical protein
MSTERTTVTIGAPATDVSLDTTVVTVTAPTGPRGLTGGLMDLAALEARVAALEATAITTTEA